MRTVTISVKGQVGSGKTSIMNLIKKALQEAGHTYSPTIHGHQEERIDVIFKN